MSTRTPSNVSQPPSGRVLNSSPPSYYEKRDHEIDQSERVKKLQEVAPKGGKAYIKERQKSLQELHKVIKNEM